MSLERPAAPSSHAPQRLDLRPGQTQSLHLPAGTLLQVRSGSLVLTEAPQWLGDTVHQLKRCVQAGQGHVLTQGGWLQLQAGNAPAALELRRSPALSAIGPQRLPSSLTVQGLRAAAAAQG